ncbi:addiction module antidote protein [Tahibacter soli]|uniref:Addiction module antidote protein n=1 Tax=Tahibacter soli TaxID=2983605 RepID=A0A9X3YLI2_9GAMM|nr:addiction module antidote protein [Tahibacter soli]MDC8014467.1 putative addiction module antidote protein [Tahibacter soli]
MKSTIKPGVSHEASIVERLKRDPEFAVEYLKVALDEASDEDGRHVLLAVLRRIAQAQGVANVARAAGIKRESLSRALSEKGNPRLDTLCAVVGAMGFKLTIERATAAR